MKILWLINIILPRIAEREQTISPPTGGWLSGLSDDLVKQKEVDLIICFPHHTECKGEVCSNYKYYGFLQNNNLECKFSEIVKKVSPDVVHIWGTELKQSYEMMKVCESFNFLEHSVISVQGLLSICALHYYAGIPQRVVYSLTVRDFIKRSNIWREKKKFEKDGKVEIFAIQKCKHIIGRTDWDRACTYRLNPKAKYHFCNETLRDSFYEKQWKLEKCQKYSIFVSQCGYPIKGFHYMLKAMQDIIVRFPEAHLYTTGPDIMSKSFRNRVRQSSYARYLVKLLQSYGLEKHVTFLGTLNEEQMCNQYLKSHVFVSCSSIENSSNSIGEAMLVGCPVVSSDVGGVKNMITHEKEGLLYPYDAPYMLAFYVCEIFGNDKLAKEFSINSKKRAYNTHDKVKNTQRLLEIYEELVRENI